MHGAKRADANLLRKVSMDWLASPESWVALLTLTVLEIVLGVDNIVMVTILADRVPPDRRALTRKLGLGLAMVARIGLLFSLAWILSLEAPLFEALGEPVSVRDLILAGGGLFLLVKATGEIHREVEGESHEEEAAARPVTGVASVLAQIAALDLVFSLDSVITAVGMAEEVTVMATAIVVAVVVMIALIGPISRFVTQHPTVKMLAMSFLLLIGVMLMAEASGHPVPKGYIYFAFGFAGMVEVLNLKIRDRRRRGEEAGPAAGGGTP